MINQLVMFLFFMQLIGRYWLRKNFMILIYEFHWYTLSAYNYILHKHTFKQMETIMVLIFTVDFIDHTSFLNTTPLCRLVYSIILSCDNTLQM